MLRLCLTIVILGVAAATTSAAPDDAPSGVTVTRIDPGAPEANEVDRARLLGALLHTRVTIAFEDAPLRDVVRGLRRALGINVIARYATRSVPQGLDPDAMINLNVTDMRAIDVLEQVLEQAAIFEPCTWQMRTGFVEIGPKSRLAVPAAREVRVYFVRDLLIEPMREGGGGGELDMQGYGRSILSPGGRRKTADVLAEEILAAIVETIEPGRWDAGNDVILPTEEDHPPRTGPDAGRGKDGGTFTVANRDRVRWASIRYWRGTFIVNGPDFIHRAVGGYPAPIPPDRASPEIATPVSTPPAVPDRAPRR